MVDKKGIPEKKENEEIEEEKEEYLNSKGQKLTKSQFLKILNSKKVQQRKNLSNTSLSPLLKERRRIKSINPNDHNEGVF